MVRLKGLTPGTTVAGPLAAVVPEPDLASRACAPAERIGRFSTGRGVFGAVGFLVVHR